MPNFSMATLAGHLGRNSETRFTTGGKPVTSFSLAVSTGYGDHKCTSWYKVHLWNKEKLAQYLTQGKAVLVSGELSIREYEKKDGSKGYSVDLSANNITFLGDKQERDEFDQRPRTVPKTAAALKAGEWTGTDPGPMVSDDDVPF